VCLSNVDADRLSTKREALHGLDLQEAKWFAWCLAQGGEALLDAQATLIASVLDLNHNGTTPICRRKQEVADSLATRLQVDIMGLTKAQISEAILQSPAADLPTTKDRKAFEAMLANKRKDELALMAAQALEGETDQSEVRGTSIRSNGWLPSVIATAGLVDVTDPDAEPAFEVTDEGLEALVAAEAVAPDIGVAGIAGIAAE
jgi:hypothetical protein